MSVAAQATRGRPRDAQIDKRVLDAARDLLASDGFAGATIQAIARRAGVRSSAIYRRWPTRIALFEEAIFPGLDAVTVQPTGDLRRDLTVFVEAYRSALSHRAAVVALPALISIYQSGADPRPPSQRAWVSVRPQFRAILAAAPKGAVDPDMDPDEFLDFLLGAVLFRIHMSSLGVRPTTPDNTVEILCRAMRRTD
jgi:AcrR family transcriptional regulator